jgi:hypothetical protein
MSTTTIIYSQTKYTRLKYLFKRNATPLTVSCAPSTDKGPTGYIEIKKTKNKLGEVKLTTRKQTNTNMKKINK